MDINEHNYNNPMTPEEKILLAITIGNLNREQLKKLIKIVGNQGHHFSKYFQFDLDELSTKKIREVEKFVKESLGSNYRMEINEDNEEEETDIEEEGYKQK